MILQPKCTGIYFKFILKEFGECARPRSAWQIDPFGHSREQASLFAQFGFDGLFQGRIDWQDFDYRAQTKTREGLWQASSSLGKQAELFTGVLNNGYGPPPGFCFDAFCGVRIYKICFYLIKIILEKFIKFCSKC